MALSNILHHELSTTAEAVRPGFGRIEHFRGCQEASTLGKVVAKQSPETPSKFHFQHYPHRSAVTVLLHIPEPIREVLVQRAGSRKRFRCLSGSRSGKSGSVLRDEVTGAVSECWINNSLLNRAGSSCTFPCSS